MEVTEIKEKEKFDIATMSTICKNQDGEVVIEGVATVIPPESKFLRESSL